MLGSFVCSIFAPMVPLSIAVGTVESLSRVLVLVKGFRDHMQAGACSEMEWEPPKDFRWPHKQG